jgi:hypothetical protein
MSSSVPLGVSSILPSFSSSSVPSNVPSSAPSGLPSSVPSSAPSGFPSSVPSGLPSNVPSTAPSGLPSTVPSSFPSGLPSSAPSGLPSSVPSSFPSGLPSSVPSGLPSSVPSGLPSSVPSVNHLSSDALEKLLTDIKSLQIIEKELFDTLEINNTNLTSDQYNKIIIKINSISQMRINLYQTLRNVNLYYKDGVLNSQEALQQQAFALRIVEKQLNESKKKLKHLELEKNNKIRLIEINDYYGEKYNEHTLLMKYIIYMLVPIIIISFLFNKGLLPKLIFYVLLVIISIIGSMFIIYRLLSIWNRDNMNYQSYLWSFNIKNAPSVNSSVSISDPWLSSGQNFGMCLNNDGSVQSTGSSTKESFINDIFTKKTDVNKKADIVIDNVVMPSNF